MATAGFTSWRDTSLTVTLKWDDTETRDKELTNILTSFSEPIEPVLKGKLKAQITCKNASQVFWLKQIAQNLGIKVI